MNNKKLIVLFVNEKSITYTKEKIINKFNISEDKLFIFKNLDDKNEYFITFYILLNTEFKLILNKHFNKSIIVHKKNATFYTINALNRLIEIDNDLSGGNINYKNFKVDWLKYSNKFILLTNNNLNLISIERVFY